MCLPETDSFPNPFGNEKNSEMEPRNGTQTWNPEMERRDGTFPVDGSSSQEQQAVAVEQGEDVLRQREEHQRAKGSCSLFRFFCGQIANPTCKTIKNYNYTVYIYIYIL